MSILPDTNVVINFLAGKEPDRSFMESVLNKSSLFTSPIVIGEYMSKCSSGEETFFKDFIDLGKVISIDSEIGFIAGNYRQQFLQKRKEIFLLDCFLAATCRLHDLTLVTNDLKDYPMKDIKILQP